MADALGDYQGSAAEINGAGFAGMRFKTRVSTQSDFDTWVDETRRSAQELSAPEYATLLKPSERHPEAFYSSPDPNLFSTILSKYEGSHHQSTEKQDTDTKSDEHMKHEGY